MVGATGSQLGQTWGVVRVYEIQDLVAHLDRADLALLATDSPPQPRQQFGEHTFPLRFRQRLVSLAPEIRVSGARLEELLGAADEVEGQLVTLAVAAGPVDQAVLAHDGTLGVRMLATYPFQHEAEVEPGTLPVGPDHVVAVHLARQRPPVARRGQRDHRDRM